jgi:hypothetical protein
MKAVINYLKILFLHKWYVGIACWKMGMYWTAIIHDVSKISLTELPGYISRFGKAGINVGRDKSGYYDPTKDDKFQQAWLHHVHNNKHHWQFWVIPVDNLPDDFRCFHIMDMPVKYIHEMICDWWGASKAYKGKGVEYFWFTNKNKLRLSENTRAYIEDNIEFIIKRLR